jgi:hypothetical protein
MSKCYVITATVPATPTPVLVEVAFDSASTFLAGFKQVQQGWSFDNGVWTWWGLAGQESSAIVAVTGPGVSAKVGLGGGGMDVPVTFTLQGPSGPIATHITPAKVTSDTFMFDVEGAGWSDQPNLVIFMRQFLS